MVEKGNKLRFIQLHYQSCVSFEVGSFIVAIVVGHVPCYNQLRKLSSSPQQLLVTTSEWRAILLNELIFLLKRHYFINGDIYSAAPQFPLFRLYKHQFYILYQLNKVINSYSLSSLPFFLASSFLFCDVDQILLLYENVFRYIAIVFIVRIHGRKGDILENRKYRKEVKDDVPFIAIFSFTKIQSQQFCYKELMNDSFILDFFFLTVFNIYLTYKTVVLYIPVSSHLLRLFCSN